MKTDMTFRDLKGSALTNAEGDANFRRLMYWSGLWIDGTSYEANEVVTDDGWLMIANKLTDEKPAPTFSGDEIHVYPGPDPIWTVNQYTGHVYQAVEIKTPVDGLYSLEIIRAWVQGITADDHYQVLAQDSAGLFEELRSFDGDVLTSPGWFNIPWRADLLPPESTSRIWLHHWNSGSSSSQTYPWIREPNINQNVDPGSGNWSTRNNTANVRINYLDNNGQDRSSVLTDAGLVGSLLTMTQANDPTKWMAFTVNSVNDDAGFVWYATSGEGSGPGGEPDVGAICNIEFQIPIVLPASYVSLAGHLGQFPSLQSYQSFDSPTVGIPGQDGLGIDLLFQPWYLSPDWDIMARTGGNAISEV